MLKRVKEEKIFLQHHLGLYCQKMHVFFASLQQRLHIISENQKMDERELQVM